MASDGKILRHSDAETEQKKNASKKGDLQCFDRMKRPQSAQDQNGRLGQEINVCDNGAERTVPCGRDDEPIQTAFL
jgi:hypothetical protein